MKAIELDSTNLLAVENLIEMYLLTNRVADFKELYAKYKTDILKREGGTLCAFYETIEGYLQQDVPKMKTTVSDFLRIITPGKQRRSTWDFEDALGAIKPKADSSHGAILLALIEVVRGNADRDETLGKIESLT